MSANFNASDKLRQYWPRIAAVLTEEPATADEIVAKIGGGRESIRLALKRAGYQGIVKITIGKRKNGDPRELYSRKVPHDQG